MQDSVTARRIIVIGAAKSVGRAIVEGFSSAGCRVHACDIDEGGLSDLALGDSNVTVHKMDACDPAEVESVLNRILTETNGVDVLVNTVGLSGPRGPLENVSYSEWDSTIRGSVGAAFFCIKQALPWMKRQRSGCIVVFSSCSTKTGLPNRTPYVVAKYAIEGLTRNLARELGPFNIRVNAILPGMIDNGRLRRVLTEVAAGEGVPVEELEANALQFISMRRKISVGEVAAAVLFLASSAAPQITGQLLSVDGNAEWEQ